MIISVDFDNTIVNSEFPKIINILANVKKTMKKIKENGHKILIYTCRENEYKQDMIKFLVKKQIPFDSVNTHIVLHFLGETLEQGLDRKKIYADYYIDDRNLGIKKDKDGNVDWFYVEKELIKEGIIK